MSNGAPVVGLSAETEVTLPGPSVTCWATATACPEIKSLGPVPSPFQPMLIVPSGARKTPFWVIFEA
jgi:hypothetical protein